jgi:hypothetical protein
MKNIIWKPIKGLWQPQKAKDEISGKLLGVQDKVGEYESKAYLIETDEEIMMVFSSTVLSDKMRIIQIGDFVKIVYGGVKESGKNEYKIYDVFKGCSSDAAKSTDD